MQHNVMRMKTSRAREKHGQRTNLGNSGAVLISVFDALIGPQFRNVIGNLLREANLGVTLLDELLRALVFVGNLHNMHDVPCRE